MSRTGTQENSTANSVDAANAAAANQRTTAATTKFNSDQAAIAAGQHPFGTPFNTPEYLRNENMNFATTADATAGAAKENIANTALRTGDNSASYLSAIQNNQREAQRVANSGLNAQRSQDYLNDQSYTQAMLNTDLAPAGISQQQYSTSIGGQDAALGNLTSIGNASYGPWNSAISAAGAAIGGACPVEGVAVLMANDTFKRVEDLRDGDTLRSQDGGMDRVKGNPLARRELCVGVAMENGLNLLCSESHAMARPLGGFVNASESLNQVVRTTNGDFRVIDVEPLGEQTVYVIKTDRTHTYCAEGVWSLE